MVGRNNTYDRWVVDLGATEHITHISDFLDNKITNLKKHMSSFQMVIKCPSWVRVNTPYPNVLK